MTYHHINYTVQKISRVFFQTLKVGHRAACRQSTLSLPCYLLGQSHSTMNLVCIVSIGAVLLFSSSSLVVLINADCELESVRLLHEAGESIICFNMLQLMHCMLSYVICLITFSSLEFCRFNMEAKCNTRRRGQCGMLDYTRTNNISQHKIYDV